MQSVNNLRKTSRSLLKEETPFELFYSNFSFLPREERKGLTRFARKGRIVGWAQMVPLNRANTWRGRRGITPFEARISRETSGAERAAIYDGERRHLRGNCGQTIIFMRRSLASKQIFVIRPPQCRFQSRGIIPFSKEHVCPHTPFHRSFPSISSGFCNNLCFIQYWKDTLFHEILNSNCWIDRISRELCHNPTHSEFNFR